ncbi:hypothetical protein CEXT_381581 [Caerostris extrusa]|uniref:Uncharacterized protein n=1 Tax=Caerostris extrusa TaxID=172846 RepID=A0AAV4WDG5_CAEEX|nr:hypothetical protein CEXT_381581 [Caerostris extrusa]
MKKHEVSYSRIWNIFIVSGFDTFFLPPPDIMQGSSRAEWMQDNRVLCGGIDFTIKIITKEKKYKQGSETFSSFLLEKRQKERVRERQKKMAHSSSNNGNVE